MLLVDEVDRADDEFEAFLLEILSDWTISVPELGAVHADVPPVVVLTSNRTRDVHDALKRRCLYHWIAHPDFERELAIVRVRAPEVPDALARDVAAAVEALRELELYKPPGVAETIDWAQALATLGRARLDEHSVDVDARHDPEVPRGPANACRHARSRRARAARRWRAVPDAAVSLDRVAVAFARVLRGAGLEVPVGATLDFARGARRASARRRGRSVYWAGRATLVTRPEDSPPTTARSRLLRRPGAAGARAEEPAPEIVGGVRRPAARRRRADGADDGSTRATRR